MKILSFDIESCTGNPLDGSLCSFGYCMAEDFEIVTKEDILVNPKPKKFRLGKYGEEAKIKLAYSEEEFRRAAGGFLRRVFPRARLLQFGTVCV